MSGDTPATLDRIFVLSLSVRDGDTAEIRERATLSRESVDALQTLKEWVEEARAEDKNAALLYLETCHRVEVYAFGISASRLEHLWLKSRKIELEARRIRRGQAAIEHLIRVTSSLASEVLGETQITGQVKDSAERCRKAGLLRGPLDRVVQHALRVGKKIRTNTSLGSGTVSVAHVAVDGLRDIFDSLDGKSALVVGAGSMAVQALERLEQNGIRNITWINRSPERIEKHDFAKRVRLGRFEDLHQLVWSHAVTVAATSSPIAILEEAALKAAMPERDKRDRGPHVVLDLGLPRNAEERIRKIEGFFLRNVDEFRDYSERASQKRKEAVATAEGILEIELNSVIKSWNNWEKGPLLGELFKNIEACRQEEAREHFKLENFQEIDYIMRGVLSKMMHRLVEEVEELDDSVSIQVLETLNRAWRPRAQWQQNGADPQPQAELSKPQKAAEATKAAETARPEAGLPANPSQPSPPAKPTEKEAKKRV